MALNTMEIVLGDLKIHKSKSLLWIEEHESCSLVVMFYFAES